MFYTDKNVVKVSKTNHLPEKEGIWVYKNFLKKEDCDSVISFVNSMPESQWTHGFNRHITTLVYEDYNNPVLKDWWEAKVSPPVLNSILTNCNKRLKELFSPDLLFIPEYKVVRLKEGDSMYRHKDDRTEDENASVKQQFVIDCAYVVYLSDFEGGEIYYPDFDYKFAPEKGDMVIHSGKIVHEVLPVKNNNRYTITGWLLKNKPHTEADPYGV